MGGVKWTGRFDFLAFGFEFRISTGMDEEGEKSSVVTAVGCHQWPR